MHFYEGYHFWGMHMIWWILWILLLFWIFATPYPLPGEKNPNESPQDILKKRYASGEISSEEYHERIETLGLDTKNLQT